MNTKIIKLFVTLGGVLFLASFMNSEPSITKDDEDRMEWFLETKFGMFIHFGAETPERLRDRDLSRTEKYEIVVNEFNSVEFDTNEWAHIAGRAA